MRNTEICNFADDTTPHACDTNLDELLMHLENDNAVPACWFKSIYMRWNTDECHLIISEIKHENLWTDIENDKICESNSVKLLGVYIDRD